MICGAIVGGAGGTTIGVSNVVTSPALSCTLYEVMNGGDCLVRTEISTGAGATWAGIAKVASIPFSSTEASAPASEYPPPPNATRTGLPTRNLILVKLQIELGHGLLTEPDQVQPAVGHSQFRR